MKTGEQRVAIVTGSGKGLGKAYALMLASRGYAVVVNNRTHPGVPSSAQIVVDHIVAQGGTAVAHGGAVDDPQEAAAMTAVALDRFGRLDVMVCNAGIMPEGLFKDFAPETSRQIVEINLLGTIYPLQPAWRHMVEQGSGRVVLTGSAVGMYGHGTTAVYGATRSAMVGLARSLALEVPEDCDVGINVVLPLGYTAMAAQQMQAEKGALLPVEKVAEVVAWLCSEECLTSGRIFHTGGGRVARSAIVDSASIPIEELGMAPLNDGRLDPIVSNEPNSATQASGRMLTGRPNTA
jgi:NAD(P)-dependent dehydrogenase (short-subunit alcohol dehydrogenase family)